MPTARAGATARGSFVAAVFLALALAAIGFSAWQFVRFQSGILLSDFRGFYCAGRLTAESFDPYRQGPLYRCEAAPAGRVMWHASGNVTDPVPLPPYAIVGFIPFSTLPFGAAAVTWTALLIGAWAAIALILKRLTEYSWPVVLSSIFFGALMSLSLGQIAPLAIAALCISALLLSSKREALAGAAAAAAMIEPHVALPACVALFVAVPRSRLPMLSVGIILAATALAVGVARNEEYFFHVLPAHAISDVPDVGQFSLSVLAYSLGFGDRAASVIGSVSYLVIACIGIAIAYVIGKTDRESPLIVVLPMAFAVFGGTYIHWQQVVAAIPAALLLSRRRPSSPVMTAAVVGLAVPWLYVVAWGFLIPAALAVAATLTCQLSKLRPLVAVTIVVALFALLLSLNHSLPHEGRQLAFHALTKPDDWADLSWGAYVRARIPIGHGLFFWLHWPTWIALAAVVAFGAQASQRSLAIEPV